MSDDNAGFDAIFEPVARAVIGEFEGEPNAKLSSQNELRYGTNGALSVDLNKRQWFDHETQDGGGVLKLLKSFKGLDKSDAIQWLKDNGYLAEDRRDQRDKNLGSGGDKFAGFMDHHPTDIFRYTNARGELLFEALKFPRGVQPRFIQRRPHPDNPEQWVWKLGAGKFARYHDNWFGWKDTTKPETPSCELPEVQRELYQLPEVLSAIKTGGPIYLVEGEKDVETLRKWGLVATTNSGGAKTWNSHLANTLKDAHIVVLNDNDSAGNQRVQLLGASLKQLTKSLKHLDLALHWKEMPEKGDVSDWVAAGHTREQLLALAKDAPTWRPARPKSSFGAVTWGDLDKPLPQIDWLVEDWITAHGRSIIGGESGSGKSFLGLHMAMCITRGVKFFEWDVEQGPVIYQAGEGGLGMVQRLKAYRQHNSVSSRDIPLVVLPKKIDLFSRPKDGKPDLEKLIDECRAWEISFGEKPKALFIDTLATATRGADENSGKDMSLVLSNIATIEQEIGCHVCLVHHMNSEGKKLRGHTSIHADLDQVVFVENDKETGIRKAKLVKQKDGEDGIEFKFALAQVETGSHPKTNKSQTSCVVTTVSEKDELVERRNREGFSPKPAERDVLTVMFEALRRFGVLVTGDEIDPEIPKRAIGYHVVDWSHVIDVWVEKDVSEDPTKARERLRKSWKRNTPFMEKQNIIGMERPYVWWTGKPIRGFPHTFAKFGQIQEELWTNAGQEQDTAQQKALKEVDEMGPEIPF